MVTPVDQEDAGSRCLALVGGCHQYIDYIDRVRAAAGIDEFADDAEFEAHSQVFRGRSEILDFLRAREADVASHAFHVLAKEVTSAQDGGPHAKSVELRALILPHVRQPEGAHALDRVLSTTHQFSHTGGRRRITRRA